MTERRGKYNATPATVAGVRFDSQAEARRYTELLLLARAGAIADLVIHPRYELQAAFTDAAGQRWPAIHYVADFGYTQAGAGIVEDVKGHATAVFRLKQKLFLYQYPDLTLRVIAAREVR